MVVGAGGRGRPRSKLLRGRRGRVTEATRGDSRGQMWGWDGGRGAEAPAAVRPRGWQLWGCRWHPSLGKYQRAAEIPGAGPRGLRVRGRGGSRCPSESVFGLRYGSVRLGWKGDVLDKANGEIKTGQRK